MAAQGMKKGVCKLMNRRKRILVVDDEAPNLDLLNEMLKSLGYETESAEDGFEALAKLKLDIDLVLTDAMMPGMDGFEVVQRIREDAEHHDIPVIMVTGLTSKEDRLRAVQVGANDFIPKPFDLTELRVRTGSLLKMKEAQDAIKRHRIELEEMVEERTKALRQALQDMAVAQRATQQAHLDTIYRLALAAEYKDTSTAMHLQRMRHYCGLLACNLGLSPGEIDTVTHASSMHDVGKIGIPDAILLKQCELTDQEWEVMKQHTTIGSRILGGSSSPLLQAGEVIALSHHEKWDGSGYPRGLAGQEIPLWGRICAVADVFDALTCLRPYKEAYSNEDAIQIMRAGRGRHLDPNLFDLFLDHFNEALAIQERYRNGW